MTPMHQRDARSIAIHLRRDELLTVKEYASLVRQHAKSVYRRIDAGRQPGVVRFGREIRIDLAVASDHLREM